MSCRSRIAAAVVGLALLAGCGFRPLYSEPETGNGVLAEFAAVEVSPIADRLGQRVHNHLLDMLNPRGRPAQPIYRLNVKLQESIQKLAVRRTALATRADLLVGADFWLVDSRSGQVVTSGSADVVSSYNLLDSEFATLSAENDARERSALLIAQDIRARLGVYFADRGGSRASSQ